MHASARQGVPAPTQQAAPASQGGSWGVPVDAKAQTSCQEGRSLELHSKYAFAIDAYKKARFPRMSTSATAVCRASSKSLWRKRSSAGKPPPRHRLRRSS